jgi:hypothetical protein
MIITHRIADKVFRSETNFDAPLLETTAFRLFQIEPDSAPDIRQYFHEVDGPTSNYSTVDRPWQELARLLLSEPSARQVIESSLVDPEILQIDLEGDELFIRDYTRHIFHYFYVADYLEYNQGMDSINVKRAQIISAFRRVVTTSLASCSIAAVHSSGVVLNGRAAMFLAPSTGGKTTVVQNALPGMIVLSDDHIGLAQKDSAIIAHATPFSRITSGPNQAPLGGMFLIEKAENFQLERIESLQMLSYLWDEKPQEIVQLPRQQRVAVKTVLMDACHQVPVYTMKFPKNYVDWDRIAAALQ